MEAIYLLFALVSLVEIFGIIVQHHFLSNLRVDDVYGVDRVVDVGRPRQDEYAPEAAEDDEKPEEEPVQHHGYDAPVLVLLCGIREIQVIQFGYGDLFLQGVTSPLRPGLL